MKSNLKNKPLLLLALIATGMVSISHSDSVDGTVVLSEAATGPGRNDIIGSSPQHNEDNLSKFPLVPHSKCHHKCSVGDTDCSGKHKFPLMPYTHSCNLCSGPKSECQGSSSYALMPQNLCKFYAKMKSYGYGDYEAHYHDGKYHWKRKHEETAPPTEAPTPAKQPEPKPADTPVPTPKEEPEKPATTEKVDNTWKDKLAEAHKKDEFWKKVQESAGLSDEELQKIRSHFTKALENHDGTFEEFMDKLHKALHSHEIDGVKLTKAQIMNIMDHLRDWKENGMGIPSDEEEEPEPSNEEKGNEGKKEPEIKKEEPKPTKEKTTVQKAPAPAQGGLSGGAIAAIVVGSVAVCAGLGYAAYATIAAKKAAANGGAGDDNYQAL